MDAVESDGFFGEAATGDEHSKSVSEFADTGRTSIIVRFELLARKWLV